MNIGETKRDGLPDCGRGDGDFVRLLQDRHRLSRPAMNSENAPIETKATTVFGFQCAEGILMVGDRRATAGNLIVTESVDKIIEIDEETLLAIAGVPATAFEMARVLQSSFDYFRRSQLRSMSLEGKVRALALLLKENLPMTLQGVGVVVPLFAGLNRKRLPEIYFYDALGAQFRGASYAASGSGSETVKSLMSFNGKFGGTPMKSMNLGQSVQFGLQMLQVAADLDSATGGIDPSNGRFATVKLLSANGIQSIGVADQLNFWAL
jgi:proteasome beta subunit